MSAALLLTILVVALIPLVIILALLQIATFYNAVNEFLKWLLPILRWTFKFIFSQGLLLSWAIIRMILWIPLRLSVKFRNAWFRTPLITTNGCWMNPLQFVCELPLCILSFVINRYLQREYVKARAEVTSTTGALRSNEDAIWQGQWF